MSATVRQAIVLGNAAPEALLRELVRFGVTDILLAEDAAPVPTLPKDVRITRQPAATLHGHAPLEERFLLCQDHAVLDFNLSTLLAQPGPCAAVRDGVETGVQLLTPASTAKPHPVAAPRLPVQPPRPALFLDRDGTINVDHFYVGTRDRFEWMDGALAAIRMATEAGWHVFVVTNQSGLARGLYDETALTALHDWMVDEVRDAGGNIDDIRFCPFHEDAVIPQYQKTSDWRKPAPGMILDLMARWSLDPAHCILAGDQPSDVGAAEAAGITGHLFQGGSLATFVRPLIHP